MRHLYYYIATAILLMRASLLSAAVIVDSTIDSIQIKVGEQTAFHVSATVKPGQKVRFQSWQPQQMIVPGVEVVDLPTIDTVDANDGFIKVSQHLILTSFEDTLYYIPKQKVHIDGKAFETKSLALKVLTVEVDTLHPQQFFGPRDVQDNPFSWSEWSKLILMSLLALLLYGLIWVAYIRLKSDKPIQLKVKIVKRIPPHQKALDTIHSLQHFAKGENPMGAEHTANDTKSYYTQLTDALRTYMEERFGWCAMEMTSAEIIERLKQEEDQSKIAELTNLFMTADLVKFAKYDVGMSENDRNLLSAIDFINTTKQENAPIEERIEPTVTEQERQTMRLRLSLKWAIGLMMVLSTAIVVYVCWQLYDLRW